MTSKKKKWSLKKFPTPHLLSALWGFGSPRPPPNTRANGCRDQGYKGDASSTSRGASIRLLLPPPCLSPSSTSSPVLPDHIPF